MDVKIINPFIGATVDVLKTMAQTEVNAGKPYLKDGKEAKGDVSAVIGLTGEARGTISVSFTEACVLDIVSRMLGEPFTSLDDDVKDAVGEIGNMISGQARSRLEQMGKTLHAAVPTVVSGKNHSIVHITTQPIVAIPFSTEKGDFTIEVCIETSMQN